MATFVENDFSKSNLSSRRERRVSLLINVALIDSILYFIITATITSVDNMR